MQYDSDLQGAQAPQQQNAGQQYPFVVGGPSGSASSYSSPPSGRAGAGSLMMAIFAGFNLLFLLVAAAYSIGLLENVEATTDSASFFVIALMTFIAGGLGLLCSYLGLKLSRIAQSPLFENIHKAIFLAIILSASLVLIGPIFN